MLVEIFKNIFLQRIAAKIRKLEETEVDLDDEDNSSYLVEER